MNYQDFLNKFQVKPVCEVTNEVSKEPLVSVCIHTYNHNSYIVKCLDSVLEQETSFSYEILLGDDASTDGTRELCIKYAERYPEKIRLFLHHRDNNIKINGKPSGRFNFLYNLYNARGKYIAICEGDDYWFDSLKLQKQVDFMESNKEEYVGVYTNYRICDENERIIQSKAYRYKRLPYFDRLTVLGKDSSQTLTVLYRNIKEVIQDLSKFTNFINADRVLAVMMAQHGKIKYLDFISGTYRWGSGMHSTESARKKREETIELYRAFKKWFGDRDITHTVNKVMNDIFINEMCRAVIRGQFANFALYNDRRKAETGLSAVFWWLRLVKYSSSAFIARIRNKWRQKHVNR